MKRGDANSLVCLCIILVASISVGNDGAKQLRNSSLEPISGLNWFQALRRVWRDGAFQRFRGSWSVDAVGEVSATSVFAVQQWG